MTYHKNINIFTFFSTQMALPNPTNEETPETSEESDASLPHNAPSKPPRIPPRNGDKSSPSSPQKEDENSPLASPLREVEIPEGKISDEGIPPVPPREGEKAPVTPPRNGGGSKRTPPPTPPRRVDVLREIFSQSGNYSREKPHANEEGEKISPNKNIEWEISEISTCGNNPSESFSHNFEVESLPLPPSEDVLREITPLLKYNGENFSENVREDSSPCKEGREFLPPEDIEEADFPLSPPDVQEGDEERAPTPPPKKPLIRMNF